VASARRPFASANATKRAVVAGLVLINLCAGFGPATRAQAAKSSAVAAYKAPRNGWGQPDLQGAWSNSTLTYISRPKTYGERNAYTPAEVKEIEGHAAAQAELGDKPTNPNAPAPKADANADVGGYNRGWLDPGLQIMRVRGQPRISVITTGDGRPPLPKAGAQISEKAAKELRKARETTPHGYIVSEEGIVSAGGAVNDPTDNPEDRALGERCLTSFGRNAPPPMFPNGSYNNNYQIVQGRDVVAIDVEMVHDVRIVRLNDRTHPPANIRPWHGDSVGWYEGDTLVVETTNLPEIQGLYGAWKNLKVTERFRRIGKDRLGYQFIVEDPTVWDKPWGGEYEFSALNGRLYEYACHEGNYALPGMLAGTRAQDAEKAAAAKKASPGG